MFPHYTWGYIVSLKQNPGNRAVPSLYVRVYRASVFVANPCSCSLTIREGISRTRRSRQTTPQFPHYTWGYIGGKKMFCVMNIVPSLYVRVYRQNLAFYTYQRSSLTIREGISKNFSPEHWKRGFPHYTWGYIKKTVLPTPSEPVPSLYVRVYHRDCSWLSGSHRSLTIREGISRLPGGIFLPWSVPSLYVRVYHVPGLSEGLGLGSLTIREGISPQGRNNNRKQQFPHYTWGCIDSGRGKSVLYCVPSLYVMVYRGKNCRPRKSDCSLTMHDGVSKRC